MLKISRWECGVLPRRDSDLDGKMGLSPGTGTPLHPDQGIFSCRLHSRLGLSVSHTHSRRSFLSGSSPPPPGPWLPLGRESGAAPSLHLPPVEGHAASQPPVQECPPGKLAGLSGRKLSLLRTRPVALFSVPGLDIEEAQPDRKELDLGRVKVMLPRLCHPHTPSSPFSPISSFLSVTWHQALCDPSIHRLTHALTLPRLSGTQRLGQPGRVRAAVGQMSLWV